jgi:acyl-CoA synthetase (NDP forming)
MLRQSGVIRVETIEQLMDVAQVVSGQPLPAGPGLAIFSNSQALGKVVADSASSQGLTVEELVTGVDLDAGQSVALPALRASLLKTLEQDAVHAAVAALLPARGLTVESIAEVLAECSATAGKPVVAAFTGILDASIYVEGMVGSPERAVPCFSNPGAAVAALAAVARYSEWVSRDQGHFVEPGGCNPELARSELEAPAPGRQGRAAQAAGSLRRRRPCWATTASGCCLPWALILPMRRLRRPKALGWPVVLKTTDPALRHRLDLGGVRLDIQDAESLRQNVLQMRRVLSNYGDPALEVQSHGAGGPGLHVPGHRGPAAGPGHLVRACGGRREPAG